MTTELTFEIPPTQGLKAEIGNDGSIMLSQYDPYVDDSPQVVIIEAYQVEIVAGWLRQCQTIIEGVG